jgi:hypothetical protein
MPPPLGPVTKPRFRTDWNTVGSAVAVTAEMRSGCPSPWSAIARDTVRPCAVAPSVVKTAESVVDTRIGEKGNRCDVREVGADHLAHEVNFGRRRAAHDQDAGWCLGLPDLVGEAVVGRADDMKVAQPEDLSSS